MWRYSLNKGRGLGGWGKEGKLEREGKESLPLSLSRFPPPPLPYLRLPAG